MRQIIGILLVVVVLFSCTDQRSQVLESVDTENLTDEQVNLIRQDLNLEYNSTIVLDNSDQILIPISVNKDNKTSNRISMYSINKYHSDYSTNYWNIVFYNQKTGEYRLLTEDKVKISQFFVQNHRKKILDEKVLYIMKDIDYNEDKNLNFKDPSFLFISDQDGKNLKRISPQDEDLQYFEVIPNTKDILLKTLRNTNQDAQFNNEDESIWYKATLAENNNWEVREIIDAEGRKKIENLYIEQWLAEQ